MIKKAIASVAPSGGLLIGVGALAGPTSAAPLVTGGPVNVTVTDLLTENEVNVRAPIGVAANVSGVNPNISRTQGIAKPVDRHGCDHAGPPGQVPALRSDTSVRASSSGPARGDAGGGPPEDQDRATMSDKLHVEVVSRGAVLRVRIAGKLDAATVRPFLDAVEPLADATPRMVFDCQDLTFCDSTGLRGLIIIRNRIGVPGAVTLDRPSETLRRLLAITGLTELLGDETAPP